MNPAKKPIYEIPIGTKFMLTVDQRGTLLKRITELLLQKFSNAKLIYATFTSHTEEREIHQYDYLIIFENKVTDSIAFLVPPRHSSKSIDGLAKAIMDDKITNDISDESMVSKFTAQCIHDLIVIPRAMFEHLKTSIVVQYYRFNPEEVQNKPNLKWNSPECRAVLFDRISAPLLLKK